MYARRTGSLESVADAWKSGRALAKDTVNMNKPDFVVRRVDRSHDTTLQNLFEHYLHDMAEWFQFDYDTQGRYGMDMATYWNQGIEAWIAYVGDVPIGFALVGSAQA